MAAPWPARDTDPWDDALKAYVDEVLAPGVTLTVFYTEAGWPARPTARTDVSVRWVGGDETHAPSGAVTGVDIWERPAS